MEKVVLRPDEPPPAPYRVGYLEKARDEGLKLLGGVQYSYAVRMATRLRFWGVSEEAGRLRVEPVDEFFELKLKGNVLGRTNVRVFFAVFEERKLVVVLGVYKKEEDNELPQHIIVRIRNRQRVAAGMLAASYLER